MYQTDDARARSRLIEKLDDVCSLIVRIRAGWKCQKCRRKYRPVIGFNGIPAQNLLTCSHYFNRWRLGTRFDFRNLDSLCVFCHEEVEGAKTKDVGGFCYQDFMLKKLGDEEFESLRVLSESIVKITTAELADMLNELRSEANKLVRGEVTS